MILASEVRITDLLKNPNQLLEIAREEAEKHVPMNTPMPENLIHRCSSDFQPIGSSALPFENNQLL